MRHHIGIKFDFAVEDNVKKLYWTAACGMRFVDTSSPNVRNGEAWYNYCTKTKPNKPVHIPGVGSLYPEWRTDATLQNTNCEQCDRYLQLKLLAKTEL